MEEKIYQTRYSAWDRAAQVVWFVLYVVNGLLALRFVLRAIGANAAAPFTHFIYNVTQPLMAPFASIVRSSRISNGNAFSVLEWSTLIAMAVYWLAAWLLIRLFQMADADTEHTVIDKTGHPVYFEDETPGYDYTLRHRQSRL